MLNTSSFKIAPNVIPSTVVELLRRRAFQQPEQTSYTFLADGEREEANLTYAEVDRQARAIGALLQRCKAQGERALLLYPPSLEFITAFFGCLYSGVIAVPVYPPDPARLNRSLPRFLAIANDAKPMVALTTSSILPMIEYFFQDVPLLREMRWLATDKVTGDLAEQWLEPEISSGTLAFLQYTSGSTAVPKGVMISHGNLLHNEQMIQAGYQNTEQSIGLGWLPLYHDMGLIGNVIQPLYMGFQCILMSPLSFLERPFRWLQAISRYRATVSGGPNFAYDLCVRKITAEQQATLDLSSWSLAFNGAEPINPETMERFAETFEPYGFRREAFYPCYGLAEATLIVTGGMKTALPVVETVQAAALEKNLMVESSVEGEESWRVVGSGQALLDQKIIIVEPESLTRCLPDQIGEIWISGPNVAQGYWNRPNETERTFQAYLAEAGEGPFLRTGDLGFLKNGELFITGRLKDLVIIRGRNHYPQDIERTVESSHLSLRPGCSAAFSIDIDGEERLVILAEAQRSRRGFTGKLSSGFTGSRQLLDVEAIIRTVRQAVSAYHDLQAYAVLLLKAGTIPKTSSGKIQRHACRAGFLDGTFEVIESSILEEIEIQCIGSDDSFTRDVLLDIEPQERQSMMEAHLLERAARVLKVAPSRLDRQQALSSLGLDSLMAVELKNDIESALGVILSMVTILQGPSIAHLASHILERLEEEDEDEDRRPLVPLVANRESAAEHFLSYGQRALWFMYQLAPESAAYNIFYAVRILSNLDTGALRRAFQALVDRHACLRTTYPARNGKPIQLIHEHMEIDFVETDASTWSEDRLKECLSEQAHRPFDLERDPVLRLNLFTRSAEEGILLLNAHHIAVDLWSLVVMMDELRQLYPMQKAGIEGALPFIELQYTDYGRWHAEMLASPEGERLWSYWQRQLSGELPVLSLPTDRPRPPIQTYNGASCSFKLSGGLTRKIKMLAKTEGTTIYTTLLAAFQVLLHRYSNQEEIIIGSPAAGRGRAELEGIVGYFVNPMVLRADLSGDPTFKDLLGQVRHTVLAAIEHQDYPIPLLVEQLQPKRDASRPPLFQVMFVLEKPHQLDELSPFVLGKAGARINLGGLELESFALEKRAAQFDLELMIAESGGSLSGTFQYNTDLFDAATIDRIAGHFQSLLESIVANPKQRLSTLPLLTHSELHQLLIKWNGARSDYPADRLIHELFEIQVEKTPDAIAVVFEDKQLTYRELNRRANQLAHYLLKLEMSREELVGIYTERSLDTLIGILGILKAGGAYVPIDSSYPKERLAFVIEDAQLSVLLTQRRLKENLPDHRAKAICLDTDWEEISIESEENPSRRVVADNLVYVIYTSGSTGRPKGVLITHHSLVHSTSARVSYYCEPAARFLLLSSFAFDSSAAGIFWTLCQGGTLFLPREGFQSELAYLTELIERDRISHLLSLPSLYMLLLEQAKTWQLASLNTVIVAGESCISELIGHHKELLSNTALFNEYGPTEGTVWSSVYDCRSRGLRSNVPIGGPIVNTQIYILDSYLQPVPIGVSGELYIGGPGLARGYLNRPELTAEKFIPDSFSNEPGARLYKTGDIARHLPDGNIEFLGRIDQQVKIRGYRVELGEIEVVLAEHPAVRENVVMAREDLPGERRLVSYLVAEPPAPSIGDLRSFLEKRLPKYMVPSVFVFLEALPLTPNGKVDRRALPVPDRIRPDLDEDFIAPRTQAEELLAGIWSQVLRIEKVGIHDNFFELGGDSILSIQIIAKANQAGLHLVPKQLLQHQTIAELAAVANTELAVEAEQGPVTGPSPLVPPQHRFFELHADGPYHSALMILLEVLEVRDSSLWKELVTQLLVHHDALRMRFVKDESGWRQFNAGIDLEAPFKRVDLSQLPQEEQGPAIQAAALELQAELNLSEGPLIQIALFDLGADRPGRLLIIIHHLVADAVSARFLLEDLQAAYQQLVRGEATRFPPKTTSFKRWAERLSEYSRSRALQEEIGYWLAEERMRVPHLPVDYPEGVNAVMFKSKKDGGPSSTRTLTVSLGAEQTHALLQKVPEVYGAQINDALLTALVQTFSEWTGGTSLLFDLIGHGREEIVKDVDLSRTVGWFNTTFPMLLVLEDNLSPAEALKSVKEQLRRIPNGGIGHSLLLYLSEDREIVEKLQSFPRAEMNFNYLGQLEQGMPETSTFKIAREHIKPLRGAPRIRLLNVTASITRGQLNLTWKYSELIHRRDTIERLAQTFIKSLQSLIILS
jgi:amino acid adenylation domain-containing protein/non-ribosomal peptide synthase protein (TIGR01720 family)